MKIPNPKKEIVAATILGICILIGSYRIASSNRYVVIPRKDSANILDTWTKKIYTTDMFGDEYFPVGEIED